ncbi:hypothetical protein KCU71_g505, partial [Aureobasidium melanogenum]
MYSREGTVNAILAFYQQLIKHPYLYETALKVPPASGWDTIDEEALRAIGKTDTVVDLLRHLPYLDGRGDGYLIAYETIPVNFTIDSTAMTEEVYSIPGHCVYLTGGLGREGYRLILDTERGTTTAYSIMDYELSMSEIDRYKHLPEIEQWKAHRTLPTTQFFAGWTLRYEKLVCRADTQWQEDSLCRQRLVEWIPDPAEAEAIEDDVDRQSRILKLKYPADIYDAYLRHGWADGRFDKENCRAELLEMEKLFDDEKDRLLELKNPDTDMFD